MAIHPDAATIDNTDTETQANDPVIKNARRRIQDQQMQSLVEQNPLVAFFMLLMQLAGGHGSGGLLGAFDGPSGNMFGQLLSTTFGVENPRALAVAAVGKPASIGAINVGERQQAVNVNLENAAEAAGISKDLLSGVWGIETKFGTHKTLVSGTGCAGDFQFSKGTFDSMIEKHGGEIAALAGDQLSPEVADALQSGNWKIQTEWGSDLRFHPAVSTYAAAFYLKEVSANLDVDPAKEENFGAIFAGYNIGPGNAKKLLGMHNSGAGMSAEGVIGQAATWNPTFFRGGISATAALGRYQAHVTSRAEDYKRNFEPDELQMAEISAEEKSGLSAAYKETVERGGVVTPSTDITPESPATDNKLNTIFARQTADSTIAPDADGTVAPSQAKPENTQSQPVPT